MIDAGIFLGYPIEFEELCLIYPPTVKQVVGTKQYGVYLRMFTISQEEIEDDFVDNGLSMENILTPFEFLLNNAFNDQEFKQYVQDAFLFFVHEPVTILFQQKKILIGDLANEVTISSMRIIDENNYERFQNAVRRVNGIQELPDMEEEKKLPARLREMRAKARYRDRVKAKQKDGSIKIVTMLSSICCMGLGINPLNIGELSYPAISVIMETYQQKEKYDIDIRSILAGADSKKIKPKYWIRNLDE